MVLKRSCTKYLCFILSFAMFVSIMTTVKLPVLAADAEVTNEDVLDLTPLHSVWDDYFPIGMAARPDLIDSESYSSYIKHHYSSLVAENCMKPEAIQPTEGEFTFDDGDKLVDFAYENNMEMRMHTLLWHSQIPDWFFEDPDDSTKPATSEMLLARLKTHIETIMEHYDGKIDTYDVVNEVISDGEGLRDSKWRSIVGDVDGNGADDDYILAAFKYAFQTANELGDDKVKFCINDYSIESNARKLDTMYYLAEKIIEVAEEEGISKDRIVVGFQMHINMYGPSISQIKKSLEKFIDMGIKVQVTELDVSIYKSSDEASKKLTDNVLLLQAKRYKELFELFKEESQKGLLDSVTLWGGDDGASWLNDFPVEGRGDAPLLFDRNLKAKPAYIALTDPDSLPVYIQQINAVKATTDVDKLWDLVSYTDVDQSVNQSVYSSAYSTDNATAGIKIMWDDNNLYILSQVEDKTPNVKDSFDIFLNTDFNTSEDDKHFTITSNDEEIKDITYSTESNEDGYAIQATISISDLAPEIGDKIGIDFRVNDYNEDGILTSQVVWNDVKNQLDTDLSKVGRLVLDEEIKLLKVKNGTPVIDGNADDIYNSVDATSTDVWVVGSTGSKAKFKTLWDDKNLYVLAEVTDSLLSKESANAYEQDSVELFFDQNNGKTSSYEADDYQIRVNFDNEVSYNPGELEGFTSVTNTTETGYTLEAAIPFTDIKAETGMLLGFDLQVNNDENDDGTRDSVSIWCDPSGQSWQNLSGLGNIILDGTKATKLKPGYGLDSDERMVSSFGSPVIDGEVDSVWENAQVTAPKSVSAGVYAEATFKSLWDDNALYFLAEVEDEYMSVESGNPYEQDSLEIFVDENNEKTKDYGIDDLHLRVNYENVQTLDNGDQERFFSSTKKIDGGYLIEARVQLKDKPSNGKVIGVELQINDGVGATRVGTINIFDSTNGAWNDTGKFGELILTGKEDGATSGLNPYNLMNLIKKTEKLDFTRYTNESIVTDAIKTAEEVLADKTATQQEIDDQYDALKEAIGKLELTEEAQNEKYFKPLPEEYRLDNEKNGTIERLSYDYADADNSTIAKDVNIYLPYGYDPSNTSKKYNVLYLMHGGGENVNTIFGGPGESKELKKILDNMIANGEIEPLIVVTPSFYGGINDGNVELFHEELTSEIIPLVETKYNTYLESKSTEDMKASREHRAFGGFSMGSMTTWNVFANCLDYVKYYMPLCAGFRFGGENPGEQSSAEYLASVAKNSGYNVPEDFKVFAASGSADIAHPGMEPQMNEMRELTDTFIYSSDTTKGNLYFIVCDGGTHAWGYVNQYIYNILPDLFASTKTPTVDNGLDSEGRMVSNFGSPVVDGIVDDIWNDAQVVTPQCVVGEVYASATFKSLWDDNALYLLAEVKDSNLSVQSENPYMQDSLEIFLDENNDKTVEYGIDDMHLRVNYENYQTLDVGNAERFYSKAVKKDDGYLIEARIELKSEPSNGKVMGLDLQINDGLDTERLGTINIFDATGNAWQDTSKFGDILLTGKTDDAITGLNPYNLLNLISITEKLDFTRFKNKNVVFDAIKIAEEVLALENVTQQQIDEQYNSIKAAIDKLELTEEAANEKIFIPLPDEYRAENEKQGTIEKLEYDTANLENGMDTKYLNVYLPYGYDSTNKDKKYDVLYLMHGGGENENLLFGGPGESKELKRIIDNMIAKGDIEPFIVVTPTFYGGKDDVAFFYQELLSDVIPLVESKYNTYAKSTSLKDIKASREHRAFGGFSMGSVCTWYTYINCLDYIKYYMPLSGDCWALTGDASNEKSKETAELLADVARKSGYKPQDYMLFSATGSADIAYPNLKPQIDEMKKITDTFIYSSDTTKGNLYFMVCEDGTHAWNFVNQYIYNILPDLFKESTTTDTSSNNSSDKSSKSKSKRKNSSATPTPTVTPTTTPDTVEEQTDKIPAVGFSDISNHWAKDSINDLISKDILFGYEDGTIRPDNNISRAELTTIVIRALGLEPSENPVVDFADKNSIPSWAAGYIALSKEKGIVLGFEDKTFRPDKDCSREEAVTIIMKAFKLGESDSELGFKDVEDISDWAYKYVAKATQSQIVLGYPDNTFKPAKSITRAEIFALLSMCLDKE